MPAWLAVAVPLLAAAPPGKASPWLEKPLRLGETSEKDRIARAHLLDLLHGQQEDEFRRDWEVTVPDGPAGLPDNYDILIYGQSAGIALLRLEIQVRGGQALAELVTVAGIRRGELPAAECDDLARQAAYAFQAEQTRRRTKLEEYSQSLGYWTHASSGRSQRLELVSRDPLIRCHLRTEAWQTLADKVSVYTAGLPGLVHTRVSEALEQMARERLPLMKPDDELRCGLVARLRQIATPTGGAHSGAAGGPPRSAGSEGASWWEAMAQRYELRDDLAAIEAQLYGRLAVEWACRDALSELRRLRLDEAAARLEVVTAVEPTERLRELLTDESWALFQWALEYAAALPPASQRELLLFALSRRKNGFEVADVLDRLRRLEPGENEQDAVTTLYRAAQDPRTRIAAAGFLLDRSGDDQYYDYLQGEALRPEEKKDDVYAPQRSALQALLRFSAAEKRKREPTAALVRTLLNRIPFDAHADFSGMRTLVSALGTLGTSQDVPLLARYCEHSDASLVVTAVETLSRLKPELALEKAKAQIQEYVTEQELRGGFGWNVEPYLDMIFWRGDRSAAELLQQAYDKPRPDRRYGETGVADTPRLLAYLRAVDLETRTRAALEFARSRRISSEWLQDVGRRLVAAGAAAETCEPLLHPELHRPPEPQGRPIEGTHW